MPHPVILLNGTSSSGKTSIARALQKVWPGPLLYASVDSFIFMLAEHILKNDDVRKKALPPLLTAFHQSLPHLAATGHPMVIDCVLEWRSWLDEIVAALAGYQVYFVGVKCPLEELNRRERARGDRQIGFAQWQYNRVHTYGPYDLELDTHAHTPDECAEQLRKLLLSGPSPQAFPRLRAELKKSPA